MHARWHRVDSKCGCSQRILLLLPFHLLLYLSLQLGVACNRDIMRDQIVPIYMLLQADVFRMFVLGNAPAAEPMSFSCRWTNEGDDAAWYKQRQANGQLANSSSSATCSARVMCPNFFAGLDAS